MIKVIQQPKEFICTCNNCTAVLSYTGDEVRSISNGSSKQGKLYYRGIYCPVCKQGVRIENRKE